MVELKDATGRFRAVLASVDPSVLTADVCVGLVGELASVEKACALVRVRLAARVAACGVESGDPAEWLARVSGSSAGQARAELATVAMVEGLPATRAAVEAGEVSLAQAREIAGAVEVAPGAEGVLLDVARGGHLGAVRDQARAVRLGAVDPEVLRARQHRARELRWWRDREGMVRLSGALAPEVGVPLVNRLDAETDRVRRAARRDGSTEERSAHAADALMGMLAGGGKGRSGRADVVFVCDLRAWTRGHAHEGEPCHLIGGGPVPVSAVAEAVAGGALVKSAMHDGVDTRLVKHHGRYRPAELRTALELGPPPGFEGVMCVEEGCGRRYGLEWDHVDPVANGGPTSYGNLAARCWPHHGEKTESDRRAGLLGPRSGPRTKGGPSPGSARGADPGGGSARGPDPGRGSARGADPGRGSARGADPGRGSARGPEPGPGRVA